MVGNQNNNETLLHVLPNLVTTTDEVTIFATDGMINNKENFFCQQNQVKSRMNNVILEQEMYIRQDLLVTLIVEAFAW